MKVHRLAEPSRPLIAETRAAVEHVERGVERALRIVLVGDRRAEHRHDGIAHELLHEAVVARDRLGEGLEQRVLERAHLLGVEPLGQRGETGDIGEEHGHLPPVGVARDGIRRRDGREGEGRSSGTDSRGRSRGGCAPGRAASWTEGEISLARKPHAVQAESAAGARTAGRRRSPVIARNRSRCTPSRWIIRPCRTALP